MVRLDALLESWRTIRADAAQAVEEFPPSEIDFRPAAEMMTFRQLARHILEAGNGLAGMLLDGEDNFSGPEFREKLKKHASGLAEDAAPGELAAELRRSLDALTPRLAAQPAAFYEQMVTRFDGQQVTRLELLQTTKEHELTHRSQMFVYLRLKGIVPPTTRRRMARG